METETVQKEIKRPPTRSIYLLSYPEAVKVIDFICLKDTGALDSDYANISPGKVHTQVNDENWQAVVDFLLEMDVRFEVMDANDQNCIAKSIGRRVVDKKNNVRRPDLPIWQTVTQADLKQLIKDCDAHRAWLRTERAFQLYSIKQIMEMLYENYDMKNEFKKLLERKQKSK